MGPLLVYTSAHDASFQSWCLVMYYMYSAVHVRMMHSEHLTLQMSISEGLASICLSCNTKGWIIACMVMMVARVNITARNDTTVGETWLKSAQGLYII